jgi:hypothetical protein
MALELQQSEFNTRSYFLEERSRPILFRVERVKGIRAVLFNV